MAEKSGDRTHQGRLTPLTGFEDQAPHQGAILFLSQRATKIKTVALARLYNTLRWMFRGLFRLCFALDLAHIAAARREAKLVEIFQHFDRHVAPDAGGVAEGADIQGAVGIRCGGLLGKRAQLLDL